MGGATVSGVIGVGGTYNEGNTGNSGYGPQGQTALSYGNCAHYSVRDECKNCCVTIMTSGISLTLGVAVACHTASSICLPCHLACGVAEGLMLTIFALGSGDCQTNCDRQVTW